jgi:hypothetical protein
MVVFLRDFAASRENHAFPDIEKSDEPEFIWLEGAHASRVSCPASRQATGFGGTPKPARGTRALPAGRDGTFSDNA